MAILGFIITSLLVLSHGTVADYPVCGNISRSVSLIHTDTIYFQTCYSPNPDPTKVCCYPGTQVISGAWLEKDVNYPHGLQLPNNGSHFWINTSQLNIHTGGRYCFHLMYFYKCFTNFCGKPQRNITLELKVTGLKLSIKKKIALANHIGLRCSSHSNNSKNVEFRFKCTHRTGKNFTASCLANQNRTIHYYNDHWLMYRMKKPPYDCILAIQNISYDYSGAYKCVGLFLVNGKLEKVSSKDVGLTEEENVSPPVVPLPSGKDTYIYLSVLIIITALLLLLVGTCIWRRRNGKTLCVTMPPADQEPVLPYGSMGTTIAGAAALLANNQVGQGDEVPSGSYERLDGPRAHCDHPKSNQKQGVTQGASGSSSGSYVEWDSSREQDHMSGEPSAN